jgi:hypothetical protein
VEKNILEIFLSNQKKTKDLLQQQFSDSSKQSHIRHAFFSAVRVRKEVQRKTEWLKSLKLIFFLSIVSCTLTVLFIVINIALLQCIDNLVLILFSVL